jgi:Tol biopolymer transport system component
MTHADDHAPPGPARIRWGLASVVMGVALLVVACTGNGGGPRGFPARPSSSAATTAAVPSTVPLARPGRIPLRGRVAFASDRGGNVDLYLLELPGGRLRRLTTSPAADLSPTWAPDGARLAFRSDRDGNDEVYVMDADGRRQRNLTRDPGSDYSPAWSPDGRRIAFASARADPTGNDLWLMDVDGAHQRPLLHQQGIDEYPLWARDGSRLVFGCTLGRILPSRVGDFELCVVGANGRGLRRITDAPGISGAGGWSPDGRRIVFTSNRDQDPADVSPCGDVFLVDADGAHLTKLTDGSTRYCDPSFTPDGRHILFSSDRAHPGGDSDLYVMNPDGTGVTRLTHASSEEQEPTLTPCRGRCP